MKTRTIIRTVIALSVTLLTQNCMGDELLLTDDEIGGGNEPTEQVDSNEGESDKQSPNLSWSATSCVTKLDSDCEYPTLINPDGLTVAYSSSNTSVASINENGGLSIQGAGSVTISATFAGNDYYNPDSASYTLTVQGPTTATNRYELVTDASTLAAGDSILIVCNASAYRKILSTTQNANNRGAVEFASFNEDGTITPINGSAIIELGGEKGNWTLYVTNGAAQGYLYAASSKDNYLRTEKSADANAIATISIASGGNATIIFTGTNTRNTILYNTKYELFSCYSGISAQTTSVQIYRQVKKEISSGDVNKDGDVSIADITALVNILMGQDAEQVLYDHKAADVDSNGSVEAADVETLLNLILAK